MAASATEKTKNNIHQREPLLTKFVMSPIRGLNQAFGHLSGMGFKTVIAPLFAFSAVAVGTETLYRAMPDMNWSIPRDERAFIPKIGFEDGAELSRLVPLKAPAYAALRYVSPGFIDRYIPTGAGRTV